MVNKMVSSQTITTLCENLPNLDWITSPIHIKRLSKDFFWFSPILKPQLTDKKADIAVKPRNEQELIQLVSECVNLRIPMTLRGGGTGNYGQSVPLHGGVIIDMTACAKFHWLEEGLVCVQAGMKLATLEHEIRKKGWELRCMPSTYQSASVGGLYAGGFGGIGSINYGPISTQGTVQAIRLLTIEASPKVIKLQGKELQNYHHTYGTNGIIIDLELALAPARQWGEYLFGFSNLSQAIDFCRELTNCTGIEKRELSLYEGAIASFFKTIPFSTDNSEFLVMSLVPPHCHHPLMQCLAQRHGQILWTQSFEKAQETGITLMEYCWNHTTLQALKHNKNITNLQVNYHSHYIEEQLKQVKELLGDEILIHLEFIRQSDSKLSITGLPLINFQSQKRLNEIITMHRNLGMHVDNSHVYTLEDGKHGGVLNDAILESKQVNDPYSLLNPGKIRSLKS